LGLSVTETFEVDRPQRRATPGRTMTRRSERGTTGPSR